MVVTLGRAPRPALETPEALLLACHERIRSFAHRARQLAALDPQGASAAELASAALAISRYFSESIALHVRDEEESVLPRLKGRSASLDAALAAMEADHDRDAPWIEALVRALRHVAEHPERLSDERLALATASRRVEEHLAAHLAAEEATILPALAGLAAHERDAIVREIRARRQPG